MNVCVFEILRVCMCMYVYARGCKTVCADEKDGEVEKKQVVVMVVGGGGGAVCRTII